MTQLLCNAEDALPFLSQTVVLNPDPEGCPAGGTQLQLGPDTNLNGILDPEEIATETAICTAETPPETRIETVTLPGGLYLPLPFIVTRGQSETVVVEPGDHELLTHTSYAESTKRSSIWALMSKVRLLCWLFQAPVPSMRCG